MKFTRLLSSPFVLLAGDTLVFILVTLYGFASHGELGTAGARMLTTFVPLLVAWLVMASLTNAFSLEIAQTLPGLWRPALAILLATPLFHFLRSLVLWRAVHPIVALVIGGVSLIAILAWRLLYLALARRARPRESLSHG